MLHFDGVDLPQLLDADLVELQPERYLKANNPTTNNDGLWVYFFSNYVPDQTKDGRRTAETFPDCPGLSSDGTGLVD